MALDCNCPKCNGADPNSDEAIFAFCLNDQNELEMKSMQADMNSGTGSIVIWCVVAFLFAIGIFSGA